MGNCLRLVQSGQLGQLDDAFERMCVSSKNHSGDGCSTSHCDAVAINDCRMIHDQMIAVADNGQLEGHADAVYTMGVDNSTTQSIRYTSQM